MKIKRIQLSVKVCIISCLFCLIMMGTVRAAGQEIFRYAVVDDNTAKVYVENASSQDGLNYQIGTTLIEEVEISSLTEDDYPVRTLFLLDNSLSIPEGYRIRIQELMTRIVDGHMEGEEFRVATFAGDRFYLTDSYSSDYTAVKNVISSITYSKQKTFLTDVIHSVVDDIVKEKYMGYLRIVVIADGMDADNPDGITREELQSKLSEYHFPIYSMGVRLEDNEKRLKKMFALSRMTNAPYWSLPYDIQEIVNAFSLDRNLAVVEARIPEEVKDGSEKSIKLAFSDGQEIVFSAKMPFSAKIEDPPEPDPVSDPVPEPEKTIPLWLIVIIIVAVVLIVVLCTVIIIMKVRGKKSAKEAEEDEKDKKKEKTTAGGTVLYDEQKVHDTEEVNPLLLDGKTRYRFVLINRRDQSKTFQCELTQAITIGRSEENDIVLNYDKTVSSRHCKIMNNNGRFFIEDLGSSNKTFLEGRQVVSMQEIVTGNRVRIGSQEYRVGFERVRV